MPQHRFRVVGFYTKGRGKKHRHIPITSRTKKRVTVSLPYDYQVTVVRKPQNPIEVTETREPWQITKEEWKRLKGYETFWAFRDYSPSQWASMSERTQRQIEASHREEFRKNEKILQEHESAVVHAYEEGKPVPREVLKDYEHIIEARRQRRERFSEEMHESAERYRNATMMTKSEFAKWWQEKELRESPHLRGFEHVMRQDANRYWRVAHGDTKGVPIYVQEGVGIDGRRFEEVEGSVTK